MARSYHVYILASGRNGTLYIGVTGDLAARVWQHRTSAIEGFTERYRVHRLVHAEPYENINEAIAREKPQEMAASVEAGSNRTRQSALARLV